MKENEKNSSEVRGYVKRTKKFSRDEKNSSMLVNKTEESNQRNKNGVKYRRDPSTSIEIMYGDEENMRRTEGSFIIDGGKEIKRKFEVKTNPRSKTKSEIKTKSELKKKSEVKRKWKLGNHSQSISQSFGYFCTIDLSFGEHSHVSVHPTRNFQPNSDLLFISQHFFEPKLSSL